MSQWPAGMVTAYWLTGSGREAIEALARRARKGTVTLVYGARDEEHNNAVVLKKLIESR